MNKKILLLLPALAMVLAGCNKKTTPSSTPTSSEDTTVAVESITVTPKTLDLEMEQTAQLTATIKPITVLDKDVIWSSSNPAVASVNASGTVTAIEKGEAVITAKANADQTKTDTCTVKVTTPAFLAAKQPVLEKDFVFGAFQANLAKRLFFKGTFEDYPRGETTDDYSKAAKVRFEEAEGDGNYYVSFTVAAETKYLSMGDNHRFGSSDSKGDTCIWQWNEEHRTITRKLSDNKTYFPGTYAAWTTISGCDISQVKNDFVFQFLTLNVATIMGPSRIATGDSVQYSAGFPDGTEGELVWSVTGNDKVQVNATGLVTVAADAVDGSKATLKATRGQVVAELELTVVKLNYGTVEQPLTVEQAQDVIEVQNPTKQALYVGGAVASNSACDFENHKWAEMWLGAKDEGFKGNGVADTSTSNEWSYVFATEDSMKDVQVVISGIGEITYTSAGAKVYQVQAAGDPAPRLEKVAEYQHSTDLTLVPSENFSLEQADQKQMAATFDAGKRDGVVWSVTPVGAAAADKVTITESGLLKADANAAVGAQYTVTGALWSNPAVTKTVVVTVAQAAKVVLNAKNLMGLGTSSISYNNGHGEKEIGGVTFKYNQINGNADNQCFQFNNKTSNYIANTTAFPVAIKKIVITLHTAMTASTAGKDLFFYKTGTAKMDGITSGGTSMQYVDKKYEYELEPLNDGDTYFAVYHHNSTSGAFYVTSITIEYDL